MEGGIIKFNQELSNQPNLIDHQQKTEKKKTTKMRNELNATCHVLEEVGREGFSEIGLTTREDSKNLLYKMGFLQMFKYENLKKIPFTKQTFAKVSMVGRHI